MAAAAALAACGGGSASEPAKLPLAGKAPGGQRYRLEPARPASGDDVASSWCLRLRYTGDLAVNDDPYSEGLSTCGPAPAPRVSGAYAIDCAHDTMYVFGGLRGEARDIELAPRHGDVVAPRFAPLPPRSGFSGTTFLIVADLKALPATLRRHGHSDLHRFAERDEVCGPKPGAADGGSPFGEFAEH
jgi:hypothetical protein